MSKEKFDFNKCCEFYSNGELERGRIMLYSNIDVFLVHSGFQIQFDYDDIVQDIVMEIDKRIQESLEQGFKPPQVYRFIKMRVRGWLINRSNRQDKMTYFKSYAEDIYDHVDSSIMESYDSEIIKSFIYEMEDPIRQILLLKHYSDFKMDKISKYINLSIVQTTELYNEGINYLKEIFNNELSNTCESETHGEEGQVSMKVQSAGDGIESGGDQPVIEITAS